ncbi:MAG: AAA family ATPase [Cetobacterium sp.]|uniref:AAA family ATPase n=1 Tax=Cetobacterium sp. TaxID=2071632 RepID=UPI003F31B7BB
MKIENFKYKNSKGTNKSWEIEKIEFNNINLIVGQNATGKTRVVGAIKELSELICGKATKGIARESFEISLKDEEKLYTYILEKSATAILKEKLEEVSEGKKRILLTREKNGEGKIYSLKDEKELIFGIQENQVAIDYKNDKIHHAFIAKIVDWAEKSIFYSFGTLLGRYNYCSSQESEEDYSLKDTNKVVKNYIRARENYKDELDNEIKNNLETIGYFIESIGVEKVKSTQGEVNILYVKEKDLKGKTYQFEMSQGMFRALSTIIQLNICILQNKGEFIVIDDIGEGLDYERSTKLINLIIQKTKKSNAQVILTTNDRFVMNNVDLKYWQVIKRECGNIKFCNMKNSKDIFEEFEYTGLSNFDFLSRKLYLGEEDAEYR